MMSGALLFPPRRRREVMYSFILRNNLSHTDDPHRSTRYALKGFSTMTLIRVLDYHSITYMIILCHRLNLKVIISFNLPEQYIKKFPAKLIMIIMLEMCSAHIVHKGGAYEF